MDSREILRQPEVLDLFERSENQIRGLTEVQKFRDAVRATLEVVNVSLGDDARSIESDVTKSALEVQLARGVILGAVSMVSSRWGGTHV